jgi:thiol-disulfide isomerase/thioredoxin
MYDLEYMNECSTDVLEYIEASKEKAPQYIERYNEYTLDEEVSTKIECHKDNYTIVAFSAEWCPDCYRNIPVLAHIQEKAGLKTRVFGGLMRDAKNPNRAWACPPSPVQVDEFEVVKIPTMYILNKDGELEGKIVENAPEGKTLERAVLDILES